jgi:acyl carrier protein
MKCKTVLNEVFRQVFDNPKLDITPDMTSDDIDGWDSISHANLIAAMELRFKLRFDAKELHKLRTVGDLVQLVDGKLP